MCSSQPDFEHQKERALILFIWGSSFLDQHPVYSRPRSKCVWDILRMRVNRACGKSPGLRLDYGLLCVSDPWGDLRQATNFHGLPAISRISHNSFKRVPSSRKYLLHLPSYCVDTSLNLHLNTKYWTKHWCLLRTHHSDKTLFTMLLYTFCAYCVPTTNRSSNTTPRVARRNPPI